MKKVEDVFVYECPPEEVVVLEGRTRKAFDQGKLRQLAESLKSGAKQIQFGVCRMESGKPVLVAGERRLRACQLAGLQFRFTLREETDELVLLEIEIEENLSRVNLDFKEEVFAKERLHNAYAERYGGSGKKPWTEQKTADKLECSVGVLHEDRELAAFVREVPEVANAKNKTEAKKIVKRLKEQLERTIVLEQARVRAEDTGGVKQVEGEEKTPEQMFVEQVGFFSPKVRRGAMEEVLREFPDGHFHVVVWDPPWGVAFDKVALQDGSQTMYEDSGEIGEMFKQQLQLLYTKMAPDSHLYLFFGMRNYTEIYSAVEVVGLKTNGIPLVWHKVGVRRTRNPDMWPGRSYEPIVYARKGSKNLVVKGASDIISTPPPTRKLKGDHPSAKHPDVFKALLERSAMPGDRVLDPMCGSGMLGVACEYLRPTHQLDWTMIERESRFADLAVKNLIDGYHALVTAAFRDDGNASGLSDDEKGLPFYRCREGHTGRVGDCQRKSGKLVCPQCKGVAEECLEMDSKDGGNGRKAGLLPWGDAKPETPEWRMYWQEHPEERQRMYNWAVGEKMEVF